MDKNQKLLDELYQLTLKEERTQLTDEQIKRYIELVDYFQGNAIEIPFGINI